MPGTVPQTAYHLVHGLSLGLLTGAVTASGVDLFQAVVQGQMAVAAAGYQATAVVANPADFGSLIGSLPTMGGAASSVLTDRFPYQVLGLPVITTPNIAAGTALIGDFANGAQLWDRQQTQVLITDSHSDFFIRNILVLLAEWRGALAIYAPHAFARVTVGGGNGGGEGASQQTAQMPQHERRRTGA